MKLPLIKKEIFHPILEQAEREARNDSSWFTHVLDGLQKDQPELFRVLQGLARSAYKKDGLMGMNLTILGACLVYKGIVNQLEVEELE